MTDNRAELRKLFMELKRLRNLDGTAERVKRNLLKLRNRQVNLLEQIREKVADYNAFKRLQIESEESNLLKKLEQALLTEKRYIRFVGSIVKKFWDNLDEICKAPSAEYTLHVNSGISFPKPLYSVLRNMFYHLKEIIDNIQIRIAAQLEYIVKWRGNRFLGFTRKKNVLNNFQEELNGLHSLYNQEQSYINSTIEKIQNYQAQIIPEMTNYIRESKREKQRNDYWREKNEEYTRIHGEQQSIQWGAVKESSSFSSTVLKVVASAAVGYAIGSRI